MRSYHNAIESHEHLSGIVRSRLGFAPLVGFGVAAQMLLANVGFNVFGDADDDDRQKP